MIARVVLDLSLRREFDYLIPDTLADRVEVGARVRVPFGAGSRLGVVVSIAETSEHPALKPIEKVLGEQSLLTSHVLALARWMAGYYCCSVETALRSVVPEAVRKEEAGWRERLYVHALPPERGGGPELTARQQAVWNIIEEWRELPLQELVRLAETTPETVRKLEDKGYVVIAPRREERDPYAHERFVPTSPLAPNPEQRQALDTIHDAVSRPASPQEPAPPFLLHGVTGSGKTEVYLQVLESALARGRGGIVLVPEISLTPQTVERFKARFSSGRHRTLVAVLHSQLGAGERHDEWHKIRQGRARIVIGARSAVFAPVEPLGVIIVDEEHESSYKQEEAPRYHARDVAVVRGQREGAIVILGSATPSLESYYNAKRGKYRLLELRHRVTDTRLPVVRIVDLRLERRPERGGGGPSVFSVPLREAIQQRLERGEQTILFLNRRGFSSSLQCESCGYVAECPNCSVSLTFHRHAREIRCHICGHAAPVPNECPQCANPRIRYSGLGTERVEDALRKLFPKARVSRMDTDTLKRKEDYRRVLTEFRTGRIDVLVGTQMIAKGLHFPNVTLVGIIHADLALHLPDFRAGERTFQLLTQVSGRAGRGDVEGEVFVQTFTPFHPAIQFARRHDYEGFYDQEMEFRQQLRYPPLTRVALLTLKGRNDDKVKFAADHLARTLSARLGGWKDLVLAGPAPAPLARAETFYRHQILLRTRAMARLSQELASVQETVTLPDDVKLSIDVDPVDLS